MRILKNSTFSITNYLFLRRFIRNDIHRCLYCTESDNYRSKLFFDERVQGLLKKLTGKDMDKIYRKRKEGKRLQSPEYKFMTDEELKEALKAAEIRAEEKLQMPPVLPRRKEIDHTFITDDKLKGYTQNKHVFTDISFGKNDRNRIIVVREPDGTLRKADWGERGRMNEVYFPRPGRKLITPKMFKPDYLKDLLNRKEYIFTLDRACLQFEPDDPDYIRVTETVYNHINEESEFEVLRSTRHFGPLIFFLVVNRNIDNLLLENLETDKLEEAIWAIELCNIINPQNKCSHNYIKGEELDYIKAYIDQCAVNKGKLELSYNKYKDLMKPNKIEAAS